MDPSTGMYRGKQIITIGEPVQEAPAKKGVKKKSIKSHS